VGQVHHVAKRGTRCMVNHVPDMPRDAAPGPVTIGSCCRVRILPFLTCMNRQPPSHITPM